jgi:hypothetical protein
MRRPGAHRHLAAGTRRVRWRLCSEATQQTLRLSELPVLQGDRARRRSSRRSQSLLRVCRVKRVLQRRERAARAQRRGGGRAAKRRRSRVAEPGDASTHAQCQRTPRRGQRRCTRSGQSRRRPTPRESQRHPSANRLIPERLGARGRQALSGGFLRLGLPLVARTRQEARPGARFRWGRGSGSPADGRRTHASHTRRSRSRRRSRTDRRPARRHPASGRTSGHQDGKLPRPHRRARDER